MSEDQGSPGQSDNGLDDISNERLLSRDPVIVRRRVRWGECDPARVVYTPRFADYLVAAYGWFAQFVLADTLTLDDGSRLATPMRALSLEYQHVLRPDDLFDMTVAVTDVRVRTFDLLVTARALEGSPRFVGRLSPIIVDAEFHSFPLPAPALAALEIYRSAGADTPRRSA